MATITVCLALTAKRMSSKNCLVKNLETVEALGSTTIICTDKTGTLTQSKMVVSHIWNDDYVEHFVSEADLMTVRSLEPQADTWKPLERCAALCNRAEFDSNQRDRPICKRIVSGDASESALLKYVQISFGSSEEFRTRYPKVAEVPFHPTNKYHLSIHENEDKSGYLLLMKVKLARKLFL